MISKKYIALAACAMLLLAACKKDKEEELDLDYTAASDNARAEDAFGRCITSRRELQRFAKQRGPFSCYVVEVCPACSWNHLARTFLLNPAQATATR